MHTPTWKTARIVGHPEGDVWAAVSADHFDNPAGALDTVSAAAALMRGPLPAAGLLAEYLFCEELERVALRAEIEVLHAQREYLKCSVLANTLLIAHARIEAIRHRYVSATMSSLARIANVKIAPHDLLHGEAFAAMQSQPADDEETTTLIVPWEADHDG